MIFNFRTLFIAGAASLLVFSGGCKDKENKTNPNPTDTTTVVAGPVSVYSSGLTAASAFGKSKAGLKFSTTPTATAPVITIDTVTRYQQIEGWGASLTGSSAYVLNHNITAGVRNSWLQKLFNPSAPVISYIRLTMGASDFSTKDFSYDDDTVGQTIPAIEKFNLDNDTVDVIPVLKEILLINPNLKIMASPWSPPAWMKTKGVMDGLQGGNDGNKLKTAYYAAYSNYFVKYIKAMASHGITIDAITIQNEPMYPGASEYSSYPAMPMSAIEQANFIKNNLGPAFRSAGLNTKIVIFDHNFNLSDYPKTVLYDGGANTFVDGTAFHCYGGSVNAMGEIHNLYPDKKLYFTECSGGGWKTDPKDILHSFFGDLFIGVPNNWGVNVLLWNIALDENSGPVNGGCTNCRGVITVSSAGAVTKNYEYTVLSHANLVKPGAYRIGSSATEADGVKLSAFQNPDGSKVVQLLNTNSVEKTVSIKLGERYINKKLDANQIVSLVW